LTHFVRNSNDLFNNWKTGSLLFFLINLEFAVRFIIAFPLDCFVLDPFLLAQSKYRAFTSLQFRSR